MFSPRPRLTYFAALATLVGCTPVLSMPAVSHLGPPRVLSDGPPTIIGTHIKSQAEWKGDTGNERAFAVALSEVDECETVRVVERSNTLVTERRPKSEPILLLDYALGLTGIALLSVATYQRLALHKTWEEPDPKPNNPKNKQLSDMGLFFVSGAGLSTALIPAIRTSVESRDLVSPGESNVERSTARGECSPPRPLANRRLEIQRGGVRYAFNTDANGKAELSLPALEGGKTESPSPAEGRSFALVDGVRRSELDGLALSFVAGLPGSTLDLERRCNGGESAACTQLANIFVLGKEVPEDLSRALALYQRGCEGGAIDACAQVGLAYRGGIGVARDPTRAMAYYERACAGGNARSCTGMGSLYARGDGVARDPIRARTIFEKSCQAGDATGCHNLARQTAQGAGVGRSLPRAAALYGTACELGLAQSCHNLALLYAQGGGVLRDTARAHTLFGQGCDKGYGPSCEALSATARANEALDLL